jgi:adenosylhomocysteinase
MPLGNSIESMDLGFALQARCLEAVAARTVDESSCVVPVSGVIDAAVANSDLDRKYPRPADDPLSHLRRSATGAGIG